MKALYLLLPLSMMLIACSSTSDKQVSDEMLSFIDLSSPELRSKAGEYWDVVKRVEPRYPIEAAKKSISGCVELATLINSQGKAQGYKVISSYPEGVFDNNAAAAVGLWRWKATTENTSNQPVLTYLKMDFMVSPKPADAEYLAHCSKSKT
ncbi:energy transducer TonB [Pseudoalteromonas sp. NZS127_1]|uniref:energy transducer TonB n=1 Tax=unclassified Pseudoalteromonas TaxID=194690 RepID=UPI0013FDCCCE|nr:MULTISPECIES: energy transducer TonB [unclassified Pseudoalteromonas]MBG9994460.1 energy transducer TonB [Pseudoalteromonas sp. NZS127_1]MBH0074203.1 energy transducer TonB [Pseudoalteromonas sp. SWYJ118]